MAGLKLLEGARVVSEFPLGDDVVVGRSVKADIRIAHNSVSQRHARLYRSGTQVLIEDLNSTNGTAVNGSRVSSPRALRHQDSIRLGQCSLVFVDEAETSPQAVIADDAPASILFRLEVSEPALSVLGRDQSDEAVLLRRRLEQMYAITRAIGQTFVEQQLLELVLRGLFDLLPQIERGGVLLLDRPGGELEPRVARDREWREVFVPVSRTIVRQVMAERQGVLSIDPSSDQRFATSETMDSLRMRSVICAPLVARGEVFGVIQVDGMARGGRELGEDDLSLIVGVTSQTALSLANARMHARLVHEELLKQDLALATRIQSRFLRRQLPQWPGYEFALHYEPAYEVGGDFCLNLPLPEGKLGLAIGDVSGKGVSAALYMAKLTSELRYLSAAEHRPEIILEELNRSFCRDAEEGMFATVVVLAIDGSNHRVAFANGGHPSPLLRRRHGTVAAVGKSQGVALGVQEDWRYRTSEVTLEVGDALLLYTDGALEAPSELGELFGEERLYAAMAAADGSAESVKANVARAVRNFSPQPADDLTLLCAARRA